MYIKKDEAVSIIKETVEKHTNDYSLTRFKRRNTSKVLRTLVYALKVKNDDSISEPVFDDLSKLVYSHPSIDVVESEVVVEDKKTVDLILIRVDTKRAG